MTEEPNKFDALVHRAREILTAVKYAGESQLAGGDNPGYEAKVPSEFVTNLETAIAAVEQTRKGE